MGQSQNLPCCSSEEEDKVTVLATAAVRNTYDTKSSTSSATAARPPVAQAVLPVDPSNTYDTASSNLSSPAVTTPVPQTVLQKPETEAKDCHRQAEADGESVKKKPPKVTKELAQERLKELQTKRLAEEQETERQLALERAQEEDRARQAAVQQRLREEEADRAAQEQRQHELQKRAEQLEQEKREAMPKIATWCKSNGYKDIFTQKNTFRGRKKFALHTAVKHQDPYAVEVILLCGGSKDVQDSKGVTPLQLADKLPDGPQKDRILIALRS